MGLMGWLRRRRRREILAEPFPAAWEEIAARNFAHRRWLTEEERRRMRELVHVFVVEKHFEGAGGLEMTDEIRVTIAADACLLVLALPHDLYRKVDSIIVYPSTVVTPERPTGMFTIPTAPVSAGMPILGEAHLGGPVLLTWAAVLRSARHPARGHNVVFHEFAHKLDMFDGTVDGTPPLDRPEDYARWAEVCTESFHRLRARTERGLGTVLDPYGGVNEAEFFAVATEAFFDIPHEVRRFEPALYDILKGFYHQDPAARMRMG